MPRSSCDKPRNILQSKGLPEIPVGLLHVRCDLLVLCAAGENDDLYVRVLDLVGNYLDSAAVTINVDNSAPTTATITTPSTGANVTGSSVSITANALDNVGGTGVAVCVAVGCSFAISGPVRQFGYDFESRLGAFAQRPEKVKRGLFN